MGDRVGAAAARVVLSINNRSLGMLDLGFDLRRLLYRSASEVAIPRVRSILVSRADDISTFSETAHAFPERDTLAVALYHTSVRYAEWRRVFESTQREPLPHFELEVAAVLAAFIIGAATAYVLGTRFEGGGVRAPERRPPEAIYSESDLREKLRYLTLGYALRDLHLRNQRALDYEAYTEAWQILKETRNLGDCLAMHKTEIREDLDEVAAWITRNSDGLLDRLEGQIAEEAEGRGAPANTPIRLFYSYAHEDESLRDKLEEHLALLKRNSGISRAGTIGLCLPGAQWDQSIRKALDEANIILILVSPALSPQTTAGTSNETSARATRGWGRDRCTGHSSAGRLGRRAFRAVEGTSHRWASSHDLA